MRERPAGLAGGDKAEPGDAVAKRLTETIMSLCLSAGECVFTFSLQYHFYMFDILVRVQNIYC